MHTIGFLSTLIFILLAPIQAFVIPPTSRPPSASSASKSFNNGTHFQPDGYTFPSGDGWMRYQAREILDFSSSRAMDNRVFTTPENRQAFNDIRPRKSTSKSAGGNKKSDGKKNSKSISGTISDALKGIGDAVGVIITWYTGHDLNNPSCWSKSGWTPTDDSHICAVTLSGWKDKPKCFDFLELCAGKKCVFVRVIDTCAGCAAGSKHVDLTKSAFTALGSLDTGTMNVKMRKATTPKSWNTKLYGPKA